MMEKMSRIFIAVIGLVNLLRLCSTQTSGQAEITPYLLFTSQTSICRIYPNGTGFEVLVQDSGIILAVDYHLRLNYLFWIRERPGTVKRARLDDGSNPTNLVERIGYSAGLAVDWINDKIYWTDRDNQRIEMYDLNTNERLTAFFTRPLNPLGLAIYPQQDSGELFWSSRNTDNRKLEKATVTGEGRQLLSDSGCPLPVTLDFVLQTVYWADNCGFTIARLPMNGTCCSESFVMNSDVSEVLFSNGIAEFGENIYWTQTSATGKIYSANKRRGAPIIDVLSTVGSEPIRRQTLQGIKVVHPRRQPTAEELPVLHLCTTPCENGICILPSAECACFPGFSGPDCSTAEQSPAPVPTVPQESTTLQGKSTILQSESTLLTLSIDPTLPTAISPMHTSTAGSSPTHPVLERPPNIIQPQVTPVPNRASSTVSHAPSMFESDFLSASNSPDVKVTRNNELRTPIVYFVTGGVCFVIILALLGITTVAILFRCRKLKRKTKEVYEDIVTCAPHQLHSGPENREPRPRSSSVESSYYVNPVQIPSTKNNTDRTRNYQSLNPNSQDYTTLYTKPEVVRSVAPIVEVNGKIYHVINKNKRDPASKYAEPQ